MQRRMAGFVTVALTAVVLLSPADAGAQSAQAWAAQGSLLLANVSLGGSLVGGAGFESQLRYTPPSLFSVGVGFQSTTHTSSGEKLALSGVFVEPRYALDIGSDRFAPYFAGRVAMLNQSSDLTSAPNAKSSGFGVGGGAGLLVRAAAAVNFDIGVAFVRQSFNEAKATNGATVIFDSFFGYVAKGGVSIGFGTK